MYCQHHSVEVLVVLLLIFLNREQERGGSILSSDNKISSLSDSSFISAIFHVSQGVSLTALMSLGNWTTLPRCLRGLTTIYSMEVVAGLCHVKIIDLVTFQIRLFFVASRKVTK